MTGPAFQALLRQVHGEVGLSNAPRHWRKHYVPEKKQRASPIARSALKLGREYRKVENEYGEVFYKPKREDGRPSEFMLKIADEEDSHGVIQGSHIMVSGHTGSGKTTFAENLSIGIARRKNPWVIIFHGVKPGMREAWNALAKRFREKDIPARYINFADMREKLSITNFPLSTLINLGMLTKAESKELTEIFNKKHKNTMATVSQIRDMVENDAGRKWMRQLMTAIDTSPYLTADDEAALHLDRNTVYIFDYADMEIPQDRDVQFGSAYRLARNTVIKDKYYQAFHVIDEFFMTVLESQDKELKDAFYEISQTAISGRQQGISQILCYQTKTGSRKVAQPIVSSKYCFQLLHSSPADKDFFLDAIVQNKISNYDFETFFSEGDNTGRAIFYNRHTSEDPKFVQLYPTI